MKDAVQRFQQMTNELGREIDLHREHLEWTLGKWSRIPCTCLALMHYFLLDFRQRSLKELEYLGDKAMMDLRSDDAISHYSMAVSLESPCPPGILVKRSKAFLAAGSWEKALDDANQVRRFSLTEANLIDVLPR